MITYDLDRRAPHQPKYEYLYRCIRRDVRTGALPAGTRLPSRRTLAAHLTTSVSTVEHAYELLVSEGYVVARAGSGFYVAPNRSQGVFEGTGDGLGRDDDPAGADAPGDAGGKHVAAGSPGPGRAAGAAAGGHAFAGEPDHIDFRANWCSMDLFPAETWARIMRKTLSDRNEALFRTVPFNGLAELRRAIAAYLYEFKGMRCSPDRIVVGAGTEYLYGRLLQLFGPGTIIAIGDPGYKKLAQVSRHAGILWNYVPLDGEGLSTGFLRQNPADVVHASPANAFPTGIVMSAARRRELLDWLHADPSRFLIEDDYDSELRFAGHALPSLFTQDDSDRVIYLNTFSKTLVPSLRISYMVLPETLMDLYRSQMSFYSCTVSSFEQLALAEFISQGHFERHINRLTRYYRRQRAAMVDALAASDLARIATFQVPDVGTHLIASVRTRMSDETVKRAARRRSMNLAMLSDYYVRPVARDAHRVVINFASIGPDQLDLAVGLLADVFRDDIDRASRAGA